MTDDDHIRNNAVSKLDIVLPHQKQMNQANACCRSSIYASIHKTKPFRWR